MVSNIVVLKHNKINGIEDKLTCLALYRKGINLYICYLTKGK
tara:strand:- start:1616 stop:1741 length:126 start_codon:yes stop_codon:yes gene_type:complete